MEAEGENELREEIRTLPVEVGSNEFRLSERSWQPGGIFTSATPRFDALILSLAAKNNWEVDTMEVRSGNLKPERYEEIYMKIPLDTDICNTRW